MKAAIFTLDTESYKARKASAAGMVLKKLLEQSGFETAAVRVIPKDRKVAASVLKRVAEEQTAELVLTTGAAGHLESDCAPYALQSRTACRESRLRNARSVSGIPGRRRSATSISAYGAQSLMVNLPGDAKEAKEALEFILPELKRAIEMLNV